MSEKPSCRWAGRENPRVLGGRHEDDCQTETCRGCQPCSEPHCRVCGMTHAKGACAECLAVVRADLREIARLCDALPEEVESRGVAGEAMMLLGPTADPESRGHLEASVLAGRVGRDELEASHVKACEDPRCVGCAGEIHPDFVLLSWQMVWRDALDHDEAPDSEMTTAVDYIDRTMTYMAGFEHVPFEDFAQDVRRCVAHLEAVLHDGEQIERGAPCPECRRPLLRTYGGRAIEDRWVCENRRCDVTGYTTGQYQGWVEDDALFRADRLTAARMSLRFADENGMPQVKPGEVRVWGSRELVRKRGRDEQGMTLYDVSDVETRLTARLPA